MPKQKEKAAPQKATGRARRHNRNGRTKHPDMRERWGIQTEAPRFTFDEASGYWDTAAKRQIPAAEFRRMLHPGAF